MSDKEINQLKVDAANRAHEETTELFNHLNLKAIEFSIVVVRSLILINGGASVAVLSFLSLLVTQKNILSLNIGAITIALFYFAVGTAGAVVCAILAYFTVYSDARRVAKYDRNDIPPYVHENRATKGIALLIAVLHMWALIAALFSLGMFFKAVLQLVQIVEFALKNLIVT